jgi:hypothetical protein
MFRANACRLTAEVIEDKPSRNSTLRELEEDSVCIRLLPKQPHAGITTLRKRSPPDPARAIPPQILDLIGELTGLQPQVLPTLPRGPAITCLGAVRAVDASLVVGSHGGGFKVLWVHAGLAPAQVMHNPSRGNRALKTLVVVPMRVNDAARSMEDAVTGGGLCTLPNPTSSREVELDLSVLGRKPDLHVVPWKKAPRLALDGLPARVGRCAYPCWLTTSAATHPNFSLCLFTGAGLCIVAPAQVPAEGAALAILVAASLAS